MLALAAAVEVAVALLFCYVAWRLGNRVVTTPEGRAAFTFYRLWWFAVGAAALVAPIRIGLYLSGRLPGWLYLAGEHASVLLIGVGLWGLLCTLSYLYTGKSTWWPILAVAYGVLSIALIGNLDRLGPPSQVTDDGWSLRAAGGAPAPLWFSVLAAIGLVVVPAASAAGYLALLRHAPDRTARYRIVLVSTSILLWFGSGLATGLLGMSGLPAFLATRGLAAMAAILALAAYDPPAWVRARGIHRAGEEKSLPAAPASAARQSQ